MQILRGALTWVQCRRTFGAAELTNIVGAVKLQVSSPADQSAPLNIFPFALNVCAGQSLHFSNSLALFFSCSNADATTSALGMSRSAATEKHVDLFRREMRRTNLQSTRKFLRPAASQQLSPRTSSAPVNVATPFRYSPARSE